MRLLFLLFFVFFISSFVHSIFTPTDNIEPAFIVPLYKSVEDYAYYVNINIGTPKQVQRAIIDTELSFSAYIRASSCNQVITNSNVTCYDFDNSYSSHLIGKNRGYYIAEDMINFVGVNYSNLCTFDLINRTDIYILNSDGILGLSYQSEDEENLYSTWYSLLPETTKKIYAIKLGALQNTSSELHLGGYQYSNELTWSEQQTTANFDSSPVFIEIPFYHISFCGNRLDNSVSFTSVQFTSTHNCLAISHDVFNSLLDWLVSSCHEDTSQNPDDGQLFCYFSLLEDISSMPPLKFKLSANGEELSIYIGELVSQITEIIIQESAPKYLVQFCILRTDNIIGELHAKEKIVFGLRAMELFYTVVNMETRRIGLYGYPVNNTNEICPKPVVCIGEQTYKSSGNKCDNPKCRMYQYINEKGECKISILFVITVSIILIFLSLVDFLAAEIRLALEKRIDNTQN